MVEPTADPEVREALTELELYLSDTVPPLVVAGSADLLLRYSPELVAATIRSWTGGQFSKVAGASVSDYLFHAVKKIHMLGEFRLVPREALGKYLDALKGLVLADCPVEDRGLLAENFERLGHTAEASTSAPVASLHRQSAGPRGPGAAAPATEEATHRRLELYLQRLEAQSRQALAAPSGRAVLSETLAAAARESQSAADVEGYLSKLREMGLQVGTADVFRALASSLPAWALPASGGPAAPGWQPGGVSTAAQDAMRRMVAEAGDPLEGGRRFQELVRAAVERFNEGSLPQAVSTLEAAERLVAEKKVDAGTVELARRKGDEALDPERLKISAESPAQHAALRKLLNFFSALAPEGLLEQLAREDKRERRRLLLALLEAHGEPARAAAFEALAVPVREMSADQWYLRRNLLYLLRKIPRASEERLEEEVEITARHAEPSFPPPLVREAVANLGQLKHEKCERALAHLVGDLEKALGRPNDAVADPKELLQLLDRAAGALARVGTPGARRALLDHALKKDPKLGDTAARLAELSGLDLSDDAELVGRMLEVLKSNLPFKLFGLALHQNDQILLRTIEALSGTPAPAVRSAFEEIVSRFPDKEIAKAAARALAGFRKGSAAGGAAEVPAPAPASLTGDLEVFGLPALLQSLSDTGVSGSLTLRDPRGEVFGALRLRGGKLRACQTGNLSGEDAFYQLLERPVPGQFQFMKSAEALDETGTGSLKEILPLTLEAMRRYDELRQATALVPDQMRLKATDVRPSPHPGEKDGMLQKALWTRVSKGATPLECEAEIRTDAYRIRRMLAHWVEHGALKVE
jgi:Domain of unknown function (DUF4388)